jgi:hypothetical protein
MRYALCDEAWAAIKPMLVCGVEAIFDTIDCVTFAPPRVTAEKRLPAPA